jgi:hypothetical protein
MQAKVDLATVPAALDLLEVDEIADGVFLAELRVHLVMCLAELVEDVVVVCEPRNHPWLRV